MYILTMLNLEKNYTMNNVVGIVLRVVLFQLIFGITSVTTGSDGISMTCDATTDPHQCAYTVRIQQCYRVEGVTMCDTVTWACGADCCDGWKADMQAKCTIPIPKSHCPKFYINPEHGDTKFCYNDTFCEPDEVCCSEVCVKKTAPSSDQCLFDNIFHTIGETMTQTNDTCRKCTCNGNGGRSASMTCTKSVCQFSGNETVIPANYTPPIVLNAPTMGQRIRVFVLPTENVAYFNYDNLVGKDFEGNNINFTVSKDTFHHCLCENSSNTGDVINIRTDRDQFLNFNETTFYVDIIDQYEPVFTNCPDNITMLTNDTLMWLAPEVSDNVGIRSLQKPVILNNSMLAPGTYEEKYVATDWSGNVATCTFIINVIKLPVITPAPPRHIKNRHVPLIIGGSIGGVLFIVVVILLVFIMYQGIDNPDFKHKYFGYNINTASDKKRIMNGSKHSYNSLKENTYV